MAEKTYSREQLQVLQRSLEQGGTLTRRDMRAVVATALALRDDADLLDQLTKLASTHVVEIVPPIGKDDEDKPHRLSVHVLKPDPQGWGGWGGSTVCEWETDKDDDTLRDILRSAIDAAGEEQRG